MGWRKIREFDYLPDDHFKLHFELQRKGRWFLPKYRMVVLIYDGGKLLDNDTQEISTVVGRGFEKLNDLMWLKFADEYWRRYKKRCLGVSRGVLEEKKYT